MAILLGIIGACLVVIAFCVFMAEALPRLRTAYWVEERSGMRIGPFYRQAAAEKYARGRGGLVVRT